MATISLPLARRRRIELGSLVPWLVLLLVAGIVVLPVLLVILNSFQTGRPGQPSAYSLDAWRAALSDPGLLAAVWNTITITVARQVIAFPVAILLAWVLARTDVPGAEWLEFLFWVAFFLPALPVTLGWILLLDPQYGLINQALAAIPFVGQGPFNIYSFWGIVWAHLAGGTIAIKVMLLTPAFRNMDASLEEASRVHGASTLGTLLRVVMPVMLPVLVVVLLLSLIHSLQAFEIELILGFPIRLFVFSTQIYFWIQREPPQFPPAMALGTIVLGMMVPFIVIQRWITERRRYTTISGQFKGHRVRLRHWRWPVFALVLATALIISVVPLIFLVVGTFMKLFGFFTIASPWSTDHWRRVFADPIFLTSVRNTLILGLGTAVLGVALSTVVAYVVVRTRFAARAALDFMSWLPVTIPGILLGLGFLWLVLGTPPLRPLYGTIALMIVATIVATMTTSVQIVKGNFAQLGYDLEEAARVEGGGWWDAFRHVLLPIITPTLALVAALSFITAARNVSTIALLATSGTRPLSLLQLDFMVQGSYESAAVVGVIVVVLTAGIALAARVLGLRVGLQQ
jgi:iron(III) transport system permease protein